tara:strand:+ start:262 stop:453 length:192 start_codon:yes stop_codon:yes gene_type:complete
MSILNKITETLNNVSIEELKKVAISFKDNVTTEGIIIADKVNDKLMEKMNDGEFAVFAENELW